MDKISSLIEQLHSADENQRYEACVRLRIALDLPQAALDALEEATRDRDPLVAEVAWNALAAQTQPDTINPGASGEQQLGVDTESTFWDRWYQRGLGLLLLVFLAFVASLGDPVRILFFPFFPVGWTCIFPGIDAFGESGLIPLVWLLYFGMAAAIWLIRNKKVSLILYVGLALMLLLNLVGCNLQGAIGCRDFGS